MNYYEILESIKNELRAIRPDLTDEALANLILGFFDKGKTAIETRFFTVTIAWREKAYAYSEKEIH